MCVEQGEQGNGLCLEHVEGDVEVCETQVEE